jgi:outer membrane protein assembly factor BamE
MPVSLAFRLTALAAACVALSACSTFDAATGRVAGLVSPYKVEVVQGNFVSKEQKDALQLGMPRAQVRDILGSPLVTSVFHADRWEYVFTIRRQGQEPQQRKLTVFFRGDELSKVESDALLSEQEFVGSLSEGRRLVKAPVLEVSVDKLPSSPAVIAPQGSTTGTGAASNQAMRVYPPLEPVVQ